MRRRAHARLACPLIKGCARYTFQARDLTYLGWSTKDWGCPTSELHWTAPAMDEPAELYTQLWDEPPPPHLDRPQADDGDDHPQAGGDYDFEPPEAGESGELEDDEEPDAGPAPAAPVLRIHHPHPVEERPADALELKASEVIQQMTVDTLRRVEARLAELDRRSAYGTGDVGATMETVELLCSRLRRAALELNGYLDQTRKMIHELSQIQLESRRHLAYIAQRLRELERLE